MDQKLDAGRFENDLYAVSGDLFSWNDRINRGRSDHYIDFNWDFKWVTSPSSFKFATIWLDYWWFYQVLVIFGLHWAVIPIISAQLSVPGGHSVLNGIVSVTMIAQGAGALAVYVKTRHNENLKGLSASAAISAFCGITEPAMYGVNLKYGRVFITASIGAAIGDWSMDY